MTTSLDYLFQVTPPWIYVGAGEPNRKQWTPAHFYSRPGVSACARLLRGKQMRTVQGLMNEVSAALQFFEGFGENWTALEECLEYLDEWLPADAYILMIEKAEEFLIEEPSNQLEAFLKTMRCVGDWWSRPINDNDRFNRNAKPFHVLLHVSDPAAVNRISLAADKENVPLRF